MKENATNHSNTKDTQPKVKDINRRRLYFSRLKRKLLKHRWAIRSLIVLGAIVGLILSVFIGSSLIKKTKASHYLSLVTNFLFIPEKNIKTIEGRTNVLILGKGGQGHEAPDLTDTIMVLSFSRTDSVVDMISVPRDIWIPELRTKLNSAYYWGNQKEEGGGLVLAKSAVEEIVGIPISYGMVVDFEIFKYAIDLVGGVEVDVEQAFIDNRYPIPGKENDNCSGDPEYSCRYETVEFQTGTWQMDGETALKFVRSRNAQGDAGTDFARAMRQQKIIVALKNMLLDTKVLFSPSKIFALRNAFLASVETDLNEEQMAILVRLLLRAKDHTSSQVIPDNLLVNPPKLPVYDNLYVFIPKGETWDEVHVWVEGVLEN